MSSGQYAVGVPGRCRLRESRLETSEDFARTAGCTVVVAAFHGVRVGRQGGVIPRESHRDQRHCSAERPMGLHRPVPV